MKNSALIRLAAPVLGLALIGSGNCLALDSSKPILCATMDSHECVDGSGCRDVIPEEVSVPTFFRLDLKKGTVHVLKSEEPNQAEHYEEVDGRIVMQGVEDGLPEEVDGTAWTLMVEQSTGRMVGTAATRQAAIVIFGACTEI